MATTSIHKKLSKVRKPRVNVTFDVETEEGRVKKELPFVVGTMGDYSGDTKDRPLKERSFTHIDQENFDNVMKKMSPSLNFKVDNVLTDEEGTMPVDIKFKSMEDFEPGKVAKQVEPLRKLLEIREKLNDLLAKADTSPELEDLINEVMQDTSKMEVLAKELGIGEETKKEEAKDE